MDAIIGPLHAPGQARPPLAAPVYDRASWRAAGFAMCGITHEAPSTPAMRLLS